MREDSLGQVTVLSELERMETQIGEIVHCGEMLCEVNVR
jgi:hypothetical protein